MTQEPAELTISTITEVTHLPTDYAYNADTLASEVTLKGKGEGFLENYCEN